MNAILFNCIIYNSLTIITLLLLVNRNPRYMMQDYPKEIVKNVEGKTPKEKRESLLFGFPFIFILIVYPALFGLHGKLVVHYSFLENWLAIFVVVLSFNVIDLLILDWLIFCFITPEFIIIPGTKGNSGYHNYWFHFIEFLKGCGFSVIGSFVLASINQGIAVLVK